MNLRAKTAMVWGAALLAAACGCGTTPVQPIVPVATATPTPEAPPPLILATPTPSPSTQPTPAPTAPPCTEGLCEAPVTSTTPPARLTVRLFTVENGTGIFISNPDPIEPIPVTYLARVDVTAKDELGYETNGSTEPEWHFSDESLIKVTGNHTHQRRLKVTGEGTVDVWVTQEGVTSNVLTLRLGR
jgi:hypothetical protein